MGLMVSPKNCRGALKISSSLLEIVVLCLQEELVIVIIPWLIFNWYRNEIKHILMQFQSFTWISLWPSHSYMSREMLVFFLFNLLRGQDEHSCPCFSVVNANVSHVSVYLSSSRNRLVFSFICYNLCVDVNLKNRRLYYYYFGNE